MPAARAIEWFEIAGGGGVGDLVGREGVDKVV